MATATAPAQVTREVLEDRWEGATNTHNTDIGWTKAMERLDKSIRELFEDVARIEWTGQIDQPPDRPNAVLDGSGAVTDAVHKAIRQTMLDEIGKRGLAR